MKASEQALKGAALHELLWCDVQQLAGWHGLVELPEDC